MSALCVAVLAAGCSNSAEGLGPQPSGSPSTSSNLTNTAQVGRFASENPGSVNVFWLPTPQGFIVIDTGRNIAGGRRVVQEIQRTGRPVVAVLIMRLDTAQFGPGESETATAYYEPRTGALFSGDLTNNQATPALLEGNTCGWLTNLDQLRSRFPDARTIYSGHGEPGDPAEQIQAQQTYLQTFRGAVRPAVSANSPDGRESVLMSGHRSSRSWSAGTRDTPESPSFPTSRRRTWSEWLVN